MNEVSHASEPYCTAGTSASGCTALIAASGQASASAPSGFVLSAAGVEGAKDGLFFFGSHGKQANPWGNGTSYQCVVPPVKRTGLLVGTGTAGACDGQLRARPERVLVRELSGAGGEPGRGRDGPGSALVPRPGKHQQPADEPLGCGRVLRDSLSHAALRMWTVEVPPLAGASRAS